MQSILSIAVSGLNNAAARVANAASNIVNASSTSNAPAAGQNYTGFTPQDVVSISNPNTDIASNLASSQEAQVSYSADAKLIKVSQEMDQSLLNAIS